MLLKCVNRSWAVERCPATALVRLMCMKKNGMFPLLGCRSADSWRVIRLSEVLNRRVSCLRLRCLVCVVVRNG